MFEVAWKMPPGSVLEMTFSKKASRNILNMECDGIGESFAEVVIRAVQPLANKSLESSVPISGRDYVDTLANVLKRKTKNQILRNITEFDQLAGCSCCDSFISRRPFSAWLSILCDILMRVSADLSTPSTSPENSIAYWSTMGSSSSSAPSHTTAPSNKHHSPAMNYDGPFDEVPIDKRIVQVHLEGPSIVEAWRQNKDVIDSRIGTVTLSKLDKDSLHVDASPDIDAAPPIFHGTVAQLRPEGHNWPNSWFEDVINLSGNDEGTQTNPRGIPGVYTSFSAMRAFLWAAFRGTFYRNIPNTETTSVLNQHWQAGGKNFRGVALFVFDSIIPAPSGYTAFTLPADKSEAFLAKIPEVSIIRTPTEYGKWSPDEAWVTLRPIHGSQSNIWPDILHSHESGAQLRDLQGFPMKMNLWRSCWTGKGIDRLNRSYKYTIAITFTHKMAPPKPFVNATPRPAKPPAKDGDDDDDGRKKGKGSVLGRLGKKLSRMSLRGSSGSGGRSGASGA